MLKLTNGKPFMNLEQYLNVNELLDKKDDFYFFFAKNWPQHSESNTAAGINFADLDKPSFKMAKLAYYVLHDLKKNGTDKEKERIAYFEDNNDRYALMRYLQLQHKVFSPYRTMHLFNYGTGQFKDWVDDDIRQWVKTWPFKEIKQVSFFYIDHYMPQACHRDFNYYPFEEGVLTFEQLEKPHDVLWFRFDKEREMNLYDFDDAGNVVQCIPVEGHIATFNYHDWHGNLTKTLPYATLTFNIEGHFTEEFKKKIGI